MGDCKIAWVCVVKFVPSTDFKGARLRCQVGDNKPKFYGYHSFGNNGNPSELAALEYMRELLPDENLELICYGYGLGGLTYFSFDRVAK